MNVAKRGQDSYLVLLNAGVNWYETKAAAEFILAEGDKPVAAYEYCNLHGLWKADI